LNAQQASKGKEIKGGQYTVRSEYQQAAQAKINQTDKFAPEFGICMEVEPVNRKPGFAKKQKAKPIQTFVIDDEADIIEVQDCGTFKEQAKQNKFVTFRETDNQQHNISMLGHSTMAML